MALTGADECCGFGGLFAVKNAAISSAMGRRKTQNLAATEADVAVLCDVSCMTHINGLLARQGQHCRAVHIAQLLTNEVDVTGAGSRQTGGSQDSAFAALAGREQRRGGVKDLTLSPRAGEINGYFDD